MKKKTKKAQKAVKKKASTAGRTVLYANVADTNRNWVIAQAKKAGVSQSLFADAIIQFAKKSKFTFPSTGRA